MKKLVFKITFLLSSLAFVMPALAQDDAKYGEDPDQCKRDLSEYVEFVKQKSYADALPAWRRVYTQCPTASKGVYINGPKIFKALIKREKDPVKKQAFLDTLMQIYDKRIELFGQKGSVLGRKGNDLLKYNKGAYEEAYGYMLESVKLTEGKPQAAVLQNLMNASAKMYKNEKIDAGQVVSDFSLVSDQLAFILDRDKEKAKKIESYKKVEENIGKLFISTGAGSCDVLIGHFTPKFDANPKDEELLKTITKYLDKGDCTDSKLFYAASINLDEISPSAQSAYNIAKMAKNKKEYAKAAKYYNKAIELVEDDNTKAQYYYELAAVSMTSPASARSYAQKAIALKPGWGAPYLLIAKLYAASSSSCGDDKFQQASVFWLAVDVLKTAKSVDSSVAGDANKLIASYKVYFPGKEDAFAYNITEGATIQIKCWINKTTKARF